MESYFEKLKKELYIKADKIVNGSAMFKALRTGEKFDVDIPKDFDFEQWKKEMLNGYNLTSEKTMLFLLFYIWMKRHLIYMLL